MTLTGTGAELPEKGPPFTATTRKVAVPGPFGVARKLNELPGTVFVARVVQPPDVRCWSASPRPAAWGFTVPVIPTPAPATTHGAAAVAVISTVFTGALPPAAARGASARSARR